MCEYVGEGSGKRAGLSASTTQDLGIELGASGSKESVFTHWVISLGSHVVQGGLELAM